MRFILASGSPRRSQMLRDLGVQFQVSAAEIDEKRLRGEPALTYAQRLAREKAEAALRRAGLAHRTALSGEDWVVLAADTIVVHGGQVLGKPRDADDALRMLRRLSGNTHEVITAFYLAGLREGREREVAGHARTRVTFLDRPASFWKWYIATGEPMDKAGAYAAQGVGASFIHRVQGSYSNVVGLPLSHVFEAFGDEFEGDLRELCGKTG